MNTDEKSLVVRQSNHLIQASYKIQSVGEGRLIRMLIAQINPTDDDFKTYKIAVADFAKFFGLTGGSAYDLIDKAAESLAHRPISLRNGKSWLHTNWLSSAEYIEGTGYVELCFDKKLKPFLLQLKGYFSGYALDKIINFRSGYSIRLFELLKSEQFKANAKDYFKKSFEYEEIRDIFGIEKTEYQLFADFRINVIQTAVNEINANPDIRIIQVDYPKTGRKVSHVVFHCEKPKQGQLDLADPLPKFEEVPKQKEHPDYILELMAIGIEEETAYKWKRKYSVKRIEQAISYTKGMQKAGKIRSSLTGFLTSAIKDNIGASWAEAQEKAIEAKKKTDNAEELAEIEQEKAKKKQLENRKQAKAKFIELPEEDQNKIIDAYLSSAKAMEKKNFEKHKTDDVLFCIFLVKYFENLDSELTANI